MVYVHFAANPFKCGFDMNRDGMEKNTNPFLPGTDKHAAWLSGWITGKFGGSLTVVSVYSNCNNKPLS